MTLQSSLAVLALAGGFVIAAPAGPAPDTLAGWAAYAAATDARVERELASSRGFLAQDFAPDAAADRQAVRSGRLVIRRIETPGNGGGPIDVPSGLIHHWRGAVLITGLTLDVLMGHLQRDVPDLGQEDVLRAAVLSRGIDTMTVFLRLQRTKFVTVIYNTEHVVRFRHYGKARAFSASVATKIGEVEAAGTPRERELPPGDDRGFLWRWNAYWRYEEAPGGVLVECESLSLSRDVPSLLRYLVAPLVESTARESMERTLSSMRAHFGRRTPLGSSPAR